MKKLGIVLLIAMACMLIFVACDEPACEHSWSEWQEFSLATCTEAGVEQRTCSLCNDVETREITALGHDPVHHEGKDATCTDAGYAEYDTCSRCDYTTYTAIDALGHDEKTHERIEPSYTKPGYEPYTYCSRCEYEGAKTEIPAIGFTYRNITLELGELSRYATDGANLKLKLIFANDPDQIVDLENVEFEKYSASIPNGATKIQLLRYSNTGDTLWEQTDESDMNDEISAFMVKATGEICEEEGLNYLYINYNVAGIYTAGERFGVYFYNDNGGNVWQQSVLNSDIVARHAIPDGMTKFKVLRTSLVDAPLSWTCEYWGGSSEIVIGEKNYYIFTDFNGGAFKGGFAQWNGVASVIVEDSDLYSVTAEKMSDIAVGSTITLNFSATEGYYIKEVKINGEKVSLNDNGTYTLRVVNDINVEVVAEAGTNTDRKITVDLTPVVEGNEIFGIYLYNTDATKTDNEWIKVTLSGTKSVSISIPEKYNIFKIVRTKPTEGALSWEYVTANWWGQSPDIVLQDDCDKYVITSQGDGNWEGAWSVPLPTSISFDFSARPDFCTGGEQFVIILVNESELSMRRADVTRNEYIISVDVQEGESKVYLYRVDAAADTNVEGYGYSGWGQIYELPLEGGKDTFVITGADGDKFVGSWN